VLAGHKCRETALNPGVSGTAVMSDLRFMIEKQFDEAGIVVAFPQRDVHLTRRARCKSSLPKDPCRVAPPAAFG
jgi:small-conductance mechanosensitive channel